MIRPYWAVIKDSFRAAFANWVLYLMLGLISLLLLFLFPLGVKEQMTSTIYDFNLIDGVSLSKKLVSDGKAEEPSPAKVVWARLDKDEQDLLVELYGEGSDSENSGDAMQRLGKQATSIESVLVTLNEALEDPEFFDEDSWSNFVLNDEAKELLESDPEDLNSEQLGRLNRLLINTAFPREIQEGPPTSLKFRYLIWDLSKQAIPLRKQELAQTINGAIPWVLDKFVLSIGIFVAILVTAPVIPQMLEPGSLNLLLSKPIRRSGLFVSKYVGACAFTILFSSYLFFGLWMYFGIRLGIWNSAFLYCIPLYVLVFAIYFAVTAISGIIFRNTIMAVVMSILFWLVCFLVGMMYGFFEGTVEKYEIRKIIIADNDVLQIDSKSVPYRWDEKGQVWEQAFVSDENEQFVGFSYMFPGFPGLPEMLGPVYDEKNNRLYAAQTSVMYAGSPLASGHRLGVGQDKENWSYEESFPLPSLAVELFQEPSGSLIVVTRTGAVYRLNGDPVELMNEFAEKLEEAAIEATADFSKDGEEEEKGADSESANDAEETDETGPAEPFQAQGLPGSDGIEDIEFDVFDEVGPSPPIDFSVPARVVMNPKTGELLSYSRGNIEIFETDDEGIYQRRENSSLTLPGPSDLSVNVVFAGEKVMVARGDGEIFLIDSRTMEVETKFEPESNSAIQSVTSANDGSWFGIVFANGNLWLWNEAEPKDIVLAEVKGQSDVSAIAFTRDKKLWVADRVNRIRQYDLETMAILDTRTPNGGVAGFMYRWVLIPVYVICPKPGEFYHLVSHLSNSNIDNDDMERRGEQRNNPWEPFWNGLIFIGAILVLGSLYFERQDF